MGSKASSSTFRFLTKLRQMKTNVTTSPEVPKGTAEIRLNSEDADEKQLSKLVGDSFFDELAKGLMLASSGELAGKSVGFIDSVMNFGLKNALFRVKESWKLKDPNARDRKLDDILNKVSSIETMILYMNGSTGSGKIGGFNGGRRSGNGGGGGGGNGNGGGGNGNGWGE